MSSHRNGIGLRIDLHGWRARLRQAFESLDRRTGGVLRILEWAVQRFNRMHAPEAAAGIAYYAVFSLFPLLLVLIWVVKYILFNAAAPSQVINLVVQVLPITRNLLDSYFGEILSHNTTIGIVGLAGLVWAASGVFLGLVHNINRAWPRARMHGFLRGRLVALGIIAILGLLLVLFVVSSTVVSLLPLLDLPISGGVQGTFFGGLLFDLMLWVLAFGVFFALYRWVPTTWVRYREAFWGALVATLAWELTTGLFTWYLSSPFARFEKLYGTLGSSVGLLAWIYLSAIITLFGAHVSAAVAQFTRDQTRIHVFEEESLP